MLIKHKLIINTAVAITSMLVMLLLIIFSSSYLQEDITLVQDLGKVESDILQLRRNEKDFLARKQMKYLDKFKERTTILNTHLLNLSNDLKNIGIGKNETTKLQEILSAYEAHFEKIVHLQQRIGLTPKTGLYGELRSAVHEVEKILAKDDFEALSMMLQLRRNEKDFMLRLDEKYVQKFQVNHDKFNATINRSRLSGTQKKTISNASASYKTAFLNLVEQQAALGFDSNSGLQKELRATIHQVDETLASLITKTTQSVEDYVTFISQLTYLIFALSLLIATLSSLFIGRSITAGILHMKNSMIDVADKNDLTVIIETKNSDELSDMADAFNHMISSFKHLVVSVKQSVQSVEAASSSLADNIHQANSGVESQMQETDMVATAITEMVATVEEIATNTTEAADKAEQTNQNANKGKSGVDATIAQISILSDKLTESETVVNLLAEDSVTIGTVLDVIRGIAEQTNLLALNAAIEAARAGEQGRGFAVVADEVRTLASRTQESTKEIENIIGSLQTRTTNIVSLMTESRDESAASSHKASQAGQLLEQINHDVLSIMDMNTAIATAIQEQSAVATEVNRHVVSIRDVAVQTSQSSEKNNQMSEELSQQAIVLSNEISRFKV